ncbi:MAG: DUF1343 domain-containing protein [Bacteriovoracaceae bacterium]|nr:DUF1343 domain-containing protein [Bacteriovoracaceae bacterium]
MVLNGLDNLIASKDEQAKITGNIGYLCHSATVDKDLGTGVIRMQEIFGDRLVKIFGPQHGFVTDVQDNMIESTHYIHPYFKLPVLSLYSETRIPTNEMLEGIDTMVVDLQDVGTRVYTYISSLGLLMKKCSEIGVKVVVLDRPNPVSGSIIEGNVLEEGFHSFVGHHKIPQRHGMTMAEVGQLTKKYYTPKCEYDFVPMIGWEREMFFKDTGLHWVNPSPNLPTMDGAVTFTGTVLFEGTNISEGRGTTRSLEVVGHPMIEPFAFVEKLNIELKKTDLEGFTFRPLAFLPTFQKFENETCGGVQIHITNYKKFKSWQVGQFLCQKLYHELGNNFQFHHRPYEYEEGRLAIDLINGNAEVRQWIESNGTIEELRSIESKNMDEYLLQYNSILIY